MWRACPPSRWTLWMALALAPLGRTDAQQARAAPRVARLLALPTRDVYAIQASSDGEVLLTGVDAAGASVLVRVDARDGVHVLPVGGAGYALAISSDGSVLAGLATTPDALYHEGAWWDVDDLSNVHTTGGQRRSFSRAERVSGGLVLVGADGSFPYDERPTAPSGILPGISGVGASGLVTGLSRDGNTYAGELHGLSSLAVRWVDREVSALDLGSATASRTSGVSPDGRNFAGAAFFGGAFYQPVVWLGAEGLPLRALLDSDGVSFQGEALGILDEGLAFGTGSRAGQSFSWVWHPGMASDRVLHLEDWFSLQGRPLQHAPVHEVRALIATAHAYHCALDAGAQTFCVSLPRP